MLLALSGAAWSQSSHTIVVWGSNLDGQHNVPSPNSGFVSASSGHRHNLAVRLDGSVAAWGYNFYGQCNVPAPNANFVSVAAAGGY